MHPAAGVCFGDLLFARLAGPVLPRVGALHLVAAIGQLPAVAGEVSVLDDPQDDGLVVDLLEHQVLVVRSGVHILNADGVWVSCRLHCAISADPDGVGKLNPRPFDLAGVRGCRDRLSGERDDRVVEFRTALLKVGAGRRVDAVPRVSVFQSLLQVGLLLRLHLGSQRRFGKRALRLQRAVGFTPGTVLELSVQALLNGDCRSVDALDQT